ncbi:MAG: 4-hydroxybenzoate octaprenyltransferase [Pseudomonadales bacterium]|nr:4-hydroxybenzoate octaprenyltransferase [Pseudomonadales bacterium]
MKQTAPVKKVSRQQSPHSSLIDFIQLMRLDKPVGILLLLWPTLWSLWLAAAGMPSLRNLAIFTLGCVLMRSAGCVINDYADRDFDKHVSRTHQRPLTAGRIKPAHALRLFGVLCLLSLGLVLLTNALTIKLAFGAVALTAIYPYCKRHTHLPQIVLGAAFAWAIPMAWTAEKGSLAASVWLVYCTAVLWTLVYDTFYAMVDREDDLKIGIRSTAILFGESDRAITGVLQGLVILSLLLVGQKFHLHWPYFLSLTVAAALFGWQQYVIRDREPAACFRAFLHNHWVGMVVFAGIAASYALPAASP